MARTRGHLPSQIERRLAEGGHAIGPVRPIPICHEHCHGASDGAPEAHAGDHLHHVMFDLHAPASAVTRLAARQIDVDLLLGYLQARRHVLDDGDQALSVALSCCVVAHAVLFSC